MVAKKLREKKEFAPQQHKEYCGNSFYYDGKYHFCYSYDGTPNVQTKFIFKDEKSFVHWLSQKNDYKMSGCDISDDLYETDNWKKNNQRIYKDDLKKFINS